MWGIYLYEIEKIVQDYDNSWQKSLDAFYADNAAVIKIREFLEENREDNNFNELSYDDFIFFSALLIPPCNHAVLLALRNRFNQDGLLDTAEKLIALDLADEKNLALIGGLLVEDLKTFNAILADLSDAQIMITTPVIKFICQFLTNPHCVINIKPCLVLLTQFKLADAETLGILHQCADSFSFIFLAIQALTLIHNGKFLTRTSLNLILDGDNSIILSALLPLFKNADFFSARTLTLLCKHLFHAVRIKETLRFLLAHDCLDQYILHKLFKGDVGLAYHVEFIACLLQGCDLLNKHTVKQIFVLPDDYYLRMNLARIAEEGLLTNLVFQKMVESHAPEADTQVMCTIKRAQSSEELRFFKTPRDHHPDVFDREQLRRSN